MSLVFITLLVAHLRKCKRFFAEELRESTEAAGWQELLAAKDGLQLFQRVTEACSALGFRQAAMIQGKAFLGIRTKLYGLGSLDVVEVRPTTEEGFIVVARPLIPSRISKARYKKIVEQIQQQIK
jgi:hypothetical protein